MLSGLWHGASWHFMVWGGIHGIYQVCSDMLKPLKKRFCEKHPVNTGVFSFKLLKVGITFIMVSTAWIFFRADSLSDAVIYLKGIIMKPDPWVLTDQSIYRLGLDRTEMNILIFGLLIFLTVSILRYKKGKLINSLLLTQNLYFIYAVMVFMIFMIFVYGIYGPSYDAHQFIYFQF